MIKLREWISQNTKRPSTQTDDEGMGTPAREVDVTVARGYHPSRIQLRSGESATLRFVRREGSACSRELVFPSLGLKTELPEGEPVSIELPKLPPGTYEFTCGMSMLRGTVEVS